jgi:hypothetical protein
MLRPANSSDAACVAGLNKMKSVFERSSLGASPPCNIVFAWHGTPAQYVECKTTPHARTRVNRLAHARTELHRETQIS